MGRSGWSRDKNQGGRYYRQEVGGRGRGLSGGTGSASPSSKGPQQAPAWKRRLLAPITAATVVARDPSAKINLNMAIKKCRREISLGPLGIQGVIPERTMTRDLMIPGPEMATKDAWQPERWK